MGIPNVVSPGSLPSWQVLASEGFPKKRSSSPITVKKGIQLVFMSWKVKLVRRIRVDNLSSTYQFLFAYKLQTRNSCLGNKVSSILGFRCGRQQEQLDAVLLSSKRKRTGALVG